MYKILSQYFIYKYATFSVEINKENDILKKAKSPSRTLLSKAVGSERKLSGLSHNIILNTNIKRDGLNIDDGKLCNLFWMW